MKAHKNLRIWPPSNWPLVGRLFRPKEPPSTWFRGRYDFTWEVSRFQPDGSAEWWWTSFTEHLTAEVHELQNVALGQPVEVQLLGDISEPGNYGHLGMYTREFMVQAIRR